MKKCVVINVGDGTNSDGAGCWSCRCDARLKHEFVYQCMLIGLRCLNLALARSTVAHDAGAATTRPVFSWPADRALQSI